jgi:hypothetical protein
MNVVSDAPEPHILTRWYALRQVAWWRAARWTAFAAYVLPALLCLQAVLFNLYVYYVRGWQSGVVQSSNLVSNIFVAFYRELGAVLIIAAELTLAVALALAGWQISTAHVPDELAVSQSPRDLEAYRVAFLRRTIWHWVGVICLPHLVVAGMGALVLVVLDRQSSWGGWNFTPADWLMYIAVYVLLAEVAIVLARSKATLQSLVVLPLGLYMLWRGGVSWTWSLLNDLEQSDVITDPLADTYRLLISLVLAAICGFGAIILRRRSVAVAAGVNMHAPP